MEFIFDVIIEGIFYFLMEGLVGLFYKLTTLFFPKNLSEKTKKIINIVGVFVSVFIAAMWIASIFILAFDGIDSIVGWIFAVASNAYIVGAIIYSSINKRKR